MTAGMTRREADAEAWERGEHPCQLHGHTASNDPQVAECETCGVDITAIEPDEDEASPVSQAQYYRSTTTRWRGDIAMEELTIDTVVEAMALAIKAGMPGHSLVTFVAGDCIIHVEATTSDLHLIGIEASS